jgi:hypothetical protein
MSAEVASPKHTPVAPNVIARSDTRIPVDVLQNLMLTSDMEPSGETIKLCLLHTKRFVFAGQETLKVNTENEEPFAGGIYFKETRPLLGKAKIVLYNGEDKPIALCLQETAPDKRFIVCGAIPFVEGDEAMATEDGVEFFRWLEIRDTKHTVNAYPIMAWDGETFKHFLKAKPLHEKIHEMSPSRKCRDLAIEDWDCNFKLGHLVRKGRTWNIEVFPGVDPALMMCLVACVDVMF